MDTANREHFYFKCWMALKSKMPGWNDFMRDVELETACFPEVKVPLPDPSTMPDPTITKPEDREEIM